MSATQIARHGVRNALLTSVAPTGTISLFADNVSSGHRAGLQLSPHPQRADARRHAPRGGSRRLRLSPVPPAKGETAPLPDYFVDAQVLAPADHLVMQAAVQKYVDSSISKTINVPADIPFERFKDVYLRGL